MATYKVWLTVKDKYGNTKELDGGAIDIDLKQVANDVIDQIEDTSDYVTKTELEETLDDKITEVKPAVYVPEVTQNNMLKFKLTDDAVEEELEFDIDKSNDWNKIDNTTGSSYVWEPMQ
jgi:hypothetical protein